MLDTKLKKTYRKTKILIIIACIVLPALILTALYPQMEKAALEKKAKYEATEDELVSQIEEQAGYTKELDSAFDNMATEAAYYLYGTLLREQSDEYVDMRALQEYGWIADYYTIRDNTKYYAELTGGDSLGEEKKQISNSKWEIAKLLEMSREDKIKYFEENQMDAFGYLQMEFSQYGELSNVEMWMQDEISVYYDYYASVISSMEQYQDNVLYTDYGNEPIDAYQLVPKNFRVIFVLDQEARFIYSYEVHGQYYAVDRYSLYLDIGAVIPVLVLAAFVALAALILPFIKKLETGWEKLFRMPFEIIAALTVLGGMGAVGMFMLMSASTMSNIEQLVQNHGAISLIGFELSNRTVYILMLIANFLGWTLCFAAEYIVVTSFRQFLCKPIYYIKERVLCVKICRWLWRWLKKQCVHFYNFVIDIDIHEKLHSGIVKIVLVNFVVLTVLCCMWFFGIAGLLLYSVALYILLKKYGERMQRQYHNLLHATKQIAEGNLKIELDEDLGVFGSLGTELEKVQQGFSKAVAEEAKSQSMKTELITNVSHDLKTPLTAIITYIELLKEDNISEEKRASYIKTIDQKSQRLKVLIDDLFEVSKATSGSIKMNFMDVDVVNLMKQVRLEMEEKILHSSLSFRFNLPEEKVILSLDGEKTFRVFENLLSNVLKYSMPNSRVYVAILDQKSQVQVVFKNISAVELGENPEHLTERFVRGDASRKTEGSGLGLAIVKSFVELQNGKMDISIDGDLFKVRITWQK